MLPPGVHENVTPEVDELPFNVALGAEQVIVLLLPAATSGNGLTIAEKVEVEVQPLVVPVTV